jgi:hypothetical protein
MNLTAPSESFLALAIRGREPVCLIATEARDVIQHLRVVGLKRGELGG